MQPRDSASAQKARLQSLPRDSDIDAWAKKLQAQADAFIANKKPDPLDDLGFLVTNLR